MIICTFLSTLSLRRATHYDNYNLHCVEISIHALLAESDEQAPYIVWETQISIHALLAESDGAIGQLQCILGNFYPRSPCGERLPIVPIELTTLVFLSTLSLRRATGSNQTIISKTNNFYPRSPCGERLSERVPLAESTAISIHALLAESDRAASFQHRSHQISIHALLAESDRSHRRNDRGPIHFYPRSPCGERRL